MNFDDDPFGFLLLGLAAEDEAMRSFNEHQPCGDLAEANKEILRLTLERNRARSLAEFWRHSAGADEECRLPWEQEG